MLWLDHEGPPNFEGGYTTPAAVAALLPGRGGVFPPATAAAANFRMDGIPPPGRMDPLPD